MGTNHTPPLPACPRRLAHSERICPFLSRIFCIAVEIVASRKGKLSEAAVWNTAPIEVIGHHGGIKVDGNSCVANELAPLNYAEVKSG
jgi:hypothetical protein